MRGRIRGRCAWGVALLLSAGAVAGEAQGRARGWPAGSPPPGATEYRVGRFIVAAYPSESRLASTLLADAMVRADFPGLPVLRDTVWIAIAPDHRTFRAWVGPSAPEWGAAIAFPDRRLIVLQGRDAGADAGEPRQTLRHEVAHLALAEAVGADIPRWFDEGYASFAAGEWGRGEVLATSVGLIWRGVPTLAGLDSAFRGGADGAQRAYALAHHAVADLASLGGARGLALLFLDWRSTGDLDAALRARHGLTLAAFEARWRGRVRRQYGALALATDVSLLLTLAAVLFGPVWWRRRRQAEATLARLRALEAAQDARDRASALAALLGEGGRPQGGGSRDDGGER
ncbi:MAG: hypothetical protein RL139_1231 [Gemmatimonadota bacterium]|jgi:hypothetical protein